jgi:hypothetical protein
MSLSYQSNQYYFNVTSLHLDESAPTGLGTVTSVYADFYAERLVSTSLSSSTVFTATVSLLIGIGTADIDSFVPVEQLTEQQVKDWVTASNDYAEVVPLLDFRMSAMLAQAHISTVTPPWTATTTATSTQSVVTTSTDTVSTGTDVTSTPDTGSTGTDTVSTGTDVASTGTDTVSTGIDTVSTGTDVASTGTDTVSTGIDTVSTGTDTVSTGTDTVSTGTDTVSTGTDVTNTGTDTVSTGTDVTPPAP